MPVSTIYSSPNDFWIQEGAIRFELNALDDPDKLAVSLTAGAVIMAWKQGVIGYNAGLNYRTWALGASPTHFDRHEKVYVYVRLSKVGDTAQLVYPYEKIPLDPALYEDESDESDAPGYDLNYYYILLGALTASYIDGQTVHREWSTDESESFSTGVLDTDQYRRDQSSDALAQMFVLNELNNTIEVQKDLTFIAGKRIMLFRMRVLGSDNANAVIDKIATSSSVGQIGSDSALMTSLYGDKRFIRRDVNDETNTELTANKFIAKQGVETDTIREKTTGEGVTIPNDAIVDGNVLVKDTLWVLRDAEVEGEAEILGDFRARGTSQIDKSLRVLGQTTQQGTKDGLIMGAAEGDTAYVKDTKGCKIWWNGSGWMIETDYLSVNKRMYAKEVQVDEVTHVGGEQLLTDAACIADVVIPYKSDGSQAQSGDTVAFYRVFFRGKDSDGKTVYNRWRVGDQAYCQTFNIDKGITQDFTNRYYWRLVVRRDGYPQGGTFDDDTTALLADHHFIDISNIVYDESGANQMDGHATSVPSSEDNIVQLGHRGTWYIGNVLYQSELYGDTSALTERQGATLVSGGGKRGRAIVMWEGISSFVLPTPRVKISPNEVRMTLDELKIKVTGGETKEIAEYVTDNQPSFEIFQLPTNAVPTTSNEPFTTWTSAEKEKYSTPPNNAVVLNSDGRTWRFEKNNGVYVFVEFTDPWLLAQHFKIEDILDDNVITADELLQLQDWWKAMIVGEGVDFEISRQYESFGQNPPDEVDDAWEEYDAASQVIGQSSTGVYYTYIFSPNVTAPIYLQGYDGEQSVTIPDDMPTRANLQAAIDSYNLAITKWQGVYALYKAIAAASTAETNAKNYVATNIDSIASETIDEHISNSVSKSGGEINTALNTLARNTNEQLAGKASTTALTAETTRATEAEGELEKSIEGNTTAISGLDSDLSATKDGVTAVNNWMGVEVSEDSEGHKEVEVSEGTSGMITHLNNVFVGVGKVTFEMDTTTNPPQVIYYDTNGRRLYKETSGVHNTEIYYFESDDVTKHYIDGSAGKDVWDYGNPHIVNYSKAGLATTNNFATLFASEVDADGKEKLASMATYIDPIDGKTKASISAEQVFIESGDKKLDNYFRLESGDVIMHDLFANNITVEGVINNEVIKLYNPEDEEQHEEGEAYNLEDFFFKSKNQFDFSDPKAYLFDPLSIGTYIECATLLHSIDLYFPCLLWDNNNAKYVIYGVTKDGTHYTLGHLRQCIGKKFYINLGSGVTGGPTCRLFTGSTSGTVNMFVSNAYADTTNLDGEVSPLKWRADFSNTVEQSGGLHFVLLECKAGQKNGHYCIYWEVVCKYGVFYFDDETEEGCAADISQE